MIQVDEDVDGNGDSIVGRVEHVLTGAVAEFDSPADLLRFIHRSLQPPRASAERLESGGE